MPPPPPPSASYLLVFDTDSEDEEEDSYRMYHRPVPATSVVSSNAVQPEMKVIEESSPMIDMKTDEKSDEKKSNEVIDETKDDKTKSVQPEDTTVSEEEKKLTKSQKKNRKNRQKKKKKKKSPNADGAETTEAAAPTSKKSPTVKFSTVSVRTYERCFSPDAIPADGGWPLGMELDKFETLDDVDMEEHQQMKQAELKKRWEEILEKKKLDSKIIDNMTKRPDGTPLNLETRQWDYLSGWKNPLFGISNEEQRQRIFLGPLKKENNSNSSSSSRQASSPSKSKRRSRSNSVSSECFNETYNQVYVHHVRHELEQLRNDRTKSGATGCNCRKLTVYLPPKDGSGGKRAQHRRLKPSKLTQELKKRGLHNPKISREESERILHKAVAEESCCRDDDCFCVRNGIDCQADACSCWHDSHGHTRPHNRATLTIQDIENRCGNPLGMLTVDMETIDKYRGDILNSEICQPIG